MPIALNDHDNYIRVREHDDSRRIDHVPAHVYVLRIDVQTGELLLVKDRKRFNVVERKYGDHRKHFTAITKRYDRHEISLGVLLVGHKGTGKSLMAEDLCNWMLSQDLPVLLVEKPIPGDLLRAAMAVIGPCLVYFDEFGKVYTDEDDRNKLLTLFSDTSLRGAFFVVTANGSSELTEFMRFRPGRFLFHIYMPGGVGTSVAQEVAQDFHLSPRMEKMLMWASVDRETSFDTIIKLASCARDASTFDELVDIAEIMNIPALMWPQFTITNLRYQGGSLSMRDVRAELEDTILKLTVMDADKRALASYEIDLTGDGVTRDQRTSNGFSALDKKDLLKFGLYSYTKQDELTIDFLLDATNQRHHLELRFCSEAEKKEIDERREAFEKTRRENGGQRGAYGSPSQTFVERMMGTYDPPSKEPDYQIDLSRSPRVIIDGS